MDYITIQKNIGDSPRKLRLVADMIRKMTPNQALDVLQFTPKAAAAPLSKAIRTAMANAASTNLVFKSIEINEGTKMRRYRIGTAGRGRNRPYKRRLSHIKIVLTEAVVSDLNIKKESKQEDSPYRVEDIMPEVETAAPVEEAKVSEEKIEEKPKRKVAKK